MAAKSRHMHPLQYLAVVVAVLIVTFVTHEVRLFNEGLIGTLYILIITISALLADYFAGALALVLSPLGVYYVDAPPSGLRLSTTTIFKSLELLITGAIICLLSWRVRSLRQDNNGLVAAARELNGVARSLRSESRGDKKKIDRLNTMNQKLEQLVAEFLADDEYWDNRWGPRKVWGGEPKVRRSK